jgi:hypothetical protein
MAGPRITVTCDCGEQRQIAYGESYECACGRRWSTDQIPADEYGRLRDIVRRYRIAGWSVGLLFAAVMLVFAVTRPAALIVIVPGVLMVWGGWLRPFVRRRYSRAIASASRSWELRPQGPP